MSLGILWLHYGKNRDSITTPDTIPPKLKSPTCSTPNKFFHLDRYRMGLTSIKKFWRIRNRQKICTEDEWRFQIEKTKKNENPGDSPKKVPSLILQRKMQITENWKPWKRNILFQYNSLSSTVFSPLLAMDWNRLILESSSLQSLNFLNDILSDLTFHLSSGGSVGSYSCWYYGRCLQDCTNYLPAA